MGSSMVRKVLRSEEVVVVERGLTSERKMTRALGVE